MSFAIHREQRIHYTIEGSGPLVILQHGLLLSGQSWKQAGVAELLAESYRVACVDSLGHGLSDKPSDPSLYDQVGRAGDIIAVIDHLGERHAHFVGHSMGGWIGVGVAKYYPERLSTLVVGGWHPAKGLPPGPKGPVDFDGFMRFAQRTAPELTEWVTPAIEPGVRACFDALGELDGARDALLNETFQVMIWDGRDDPNHDSKKAFADENGLRFLSTAGDHLRILFDHGKKAAEAFASFWTMCNPEAA